MKIEYKVFDVKYWDSCVECSILAFGEAPWNENWTYEQVNERTHQIMGSKYSKGFVALDGTRIVGILLGQVRTYLDWKQVEVDDFCVHPKYQGQKIGTKLIEFAQKELKRENINALSLTTIRGTPAVKFYEKNGFKQSETVLFMSKSY